MSSLYYQHQQHEQQHQQREREQAQHYQYHHHSQQEHHHQHPHDQQHSHEPSYHQSQSHSQSHYQDYHRQEQHPTPPSSSSYRNSNDAHPGEPQDHLQQPCGDGGREETLDTLRAMMSQEQSGYTLDSYFSPEVLPTKGFRQQNVIHGGWREKICQWSYNVVDHFDLPREIVSISLNYFDRYMASLTTADYSNNNNKSKQSSGDLALLASLGTLHLATKVHATNHNDYDPLMGPLEEQHHKVPSLSTLANLSRGQFGPASILEMEKLLLVALQWRLHPPTLYAFVTLLLKLLPTTQEDPQCGLLPSIASELFEVAMYVAELSVCDAFFVERQIPASSIALAAILTGMDDLLAPEDSSIMAGLDFSIKGSGCFTEDHRAMFLGICQEHLGLGVSMLEESLERLRSMYSGAGGLKNPAQEDPAQQQQQQRAPSPQQQQQSRSRTNSYNPPTSPSSIADMSLSTINSTIHSMADTTTNGGGSSFKRGDSMVSSIACSKETLTVDDEDEVFGDAIARNDSDQQSQAHSHNSNNFRYSPSPPRELDDNDNHEPKVYGYNETYDQQQHPLRRNHSSIMSCSPIVALR